ncbi:PIG-L family deacetylase [bacterium]|nr:PIG-L family deacetylase [bacterium]
MNILVIGAHPDDCEFFAACTAVKFVRSGHRVKFVSVSNGDAGHHEMKRTELAERRRAEVACADTMLGVEWEILDIHDGEIVPSIDIRGELIRQIRNFRADMVFSHRPGDYHPDHRNTGILVQDTAYLVIVPNVCPESPALRKNPVYLYLQDEFRTPEPFRPDIIVPVDDVFDKKVEALHMMPSQFYEWLPWTMGTLDAVPAEESARRAWLDRWLRDWMRNPFTAETAVMYGHERAKTIKMIEAFQVCEYGTRPSPGELRELFPFLPSAGQPRNLI